MGDTAFETYAPLTQDFLEMYEAMHTVNAQLRSIKPPARCHVTTMTYVATLSCDIHITARVIETVSELKDAYWTTVGPCKFTPSAIEFHAASLPSIRVKVFNKGAVQITGAKSHVEVMHTLVEVCRVLGVLTNAAVEALTMDLVLLNVNIMLDFDIKMTRFAHLARERNIHAEQPERPPSCILKIPCTKPPIPRGKQKDAYTSTALVYKTGKFVICAASPQDVSVLYTTIMTILDNNQDVRETHRSDALRRGRGHYIWSQLVAQGMPGAMHTHNPTTHLVSTCLYCQHLGNVFSSR